MSTQGPLSAGTGANDSAFGTVAWSSPGNVTASDDSRATAVTTAGQTTQYLKATNFGFSIPSGATINGIVVEFEVSATVGSGSRDERIRIIKGETIGSTDNRVLSPLYSTTDSYVTRGSSSDLWGESWTDSDINSSTFGVAIACKNIFIKLGTTIRIDHVRITVYYTAGGGSAQGAAIHHYRQQGMMRHQQPRLILPSRELITELPPRRLIENRLAI